MARTLSDTDPVMLFLIGILMGQLYGIKAVRYLVLGLTFICVGVLDLLYLSRYRVCPSSGGGGTCWKCAAGHGGKD